jgi:hypothetical protein
VIKSDSVRERFRGRKRIKEIENDRERESELVNNKDRLK